MDREPEEMQFLGLFDIYGEAYKIIYKWRKIFTQITLSLILPLSFIFLAHLEISHLLSSKIWHAEFQLRYTRSNTTRRDKLNDLISSEEALQWVFGVLYFVFLVIFSLLSTSAVVYTIACIYTAREVTFKKVLSVVPKVWKRLMATFFFIILAFIAYNIVAFLVIVVMVATTIGTPAESISIIVFLILYIVGFVYMTIIWQLASVVTVLEDSYGFKAMIKSKKLIKGKLLITVIIFFMLNMSLVGVDILFKTTVVHHRWLSLATWKMVGFGVLCFLLLFKLILFGLVIQTIIYFVCKSYHHENIDKSSLSDHLEVYLGEYVPLKSSDVQLQQYNV